jgi:hypothetical protein
MGPKITCTTSKNIIWLKKKLKTTSFLKKNWDENILNRLKLTCQIYNPNH